MTAAPNLLYSNELRAIALPLFHKVKVFILFITKQLSDAGFFMVFGEKSRILVCFEMVWKDFKKR